MGKKTDFIRCFRCFAIVIAVVALLCSCVKSPFSPVTSDGTTPLPVTSSAGEQSNPDIDVIQDEPVDTRTEEQKFFDEVSGYIGIAPKNIILLIGDGMGFGEVAFAKIKEGAYFGDYMAMEMMPVHGQVTTYCLNSSVTDSAAAGTALATGYKTNRYALGIDGEGNILESLTELAASMGKKTGIVTTAQVYDATPAAFSAHVEKRGNYSGIILDQISFLQNGLTLLFGGGADRYGNENVQSLLERAKDKICVISDIDEKADKDKSVLGLFADAALDDANGEPNICDMTCRALDMLSDSENGFFLMIEGALIDECSHSLDVKGMISHLKAFDNAVALAEKFALENPGTMVVVVADHETGGLEIDIGSDGTASGRYTSGGEHTAMNVPVFAMGQSADKMMKHGEVIDNTDVARFLASAMKRGNTIKQDKE